MKKVAVIGGGAAGLMAAAAAKEANPECGVTLFEKNASPGAKVIISGGGRCNVTTGILDVKELLKNYPRGAKFLMTAMYRFPPERVKEWLESRGVPLKTEADLRVFPKSDNGKDVVGALTFNLRENGVEIRCSSAVERITKKGTQFKISLKGGAEETADAVIVTTGGNAYRQTGSTGDGYAFAQALGHKITPLGPSLSAWVAAEPWIKDLAGVAFKKAKLTLKTSGGKTYERVGPFLFTHRGVSGPAVFALSGYTAYEPVTEKTPLHLAIDLFPEEPAESVMKKCVDLMQKNPQKKMENFLDILLPKSMCGTLVSLLGIKANTIAGNVTKDQRGLLVRLFKALPVTVIGRSAGEEFVTAGGVDVSEVNANTMESKICPGLYFAGEILDVDGFTGGFNLQASWATGSLAGACAASSKNLTK